MVQESIFAEVTPPSVVLSSSMAEPEISIESSDRQQRMEELEIDEAGPENPEEDVQYPKGRKLWLSMSSLCIAFFLCGLDLTIVAVSVPSLTDQFKTVADLGWYTAAYGMSMSAFVFFFGQLYNIFPIKGVFIAGLVLFETGSLLCTLAPNSATFILGRAVSGLGRGSINGGLSRMVRHSFPLEKQALVNTIIGAFQTAGLVSAPALGGALIDAISWRACFGINLPLGIVCIALTAYGFQEPTHNTTASMTLREKLKRLNLIATLLVVPGVTCLLMALQWGGITYGWGDWRIILLLTSSCVLFAALGYLQFRRADLALLPSSVLKQRSILAVTWFSLCCDGILAVTEFYVSIYFQGVRGYSASRAGLLGLPLIGGLMIAVLMAGLGTTLIGYYYPFMLATSVLAPIASGLLTRLDLDEDIGQVLALLGLLGFAVGSGIGLPTVALQAVMPTKDVSLGGAFLAFGSGMGSALWVCAAAALFQTRLTAEIKSHAPGTNVTALQDVGLSGMRGYIGPEALKNTLAGYDQAVVQTLYIPLALGLLSIVGSAATERRSIKKKRS